MKVLNDYLLVRFIDDKSIKELAGGIKLIIPHRSVFQQDTGKNEGTLTQKVLDKRLINPQIAVIVEENEHHPQFKKDMIVFTHYGSYDQSQPYTHYGDPCDFIMVRTILFITDEKKSLISPVSDTYIGELAEEEPEQTLSGLWLPEMCREKAIDKCWVRMLHVPDCDEEWSVGDVIRTIDDKHYVFEFNDRKYVMVKKQYVIGRRTTQATV